MIIQRLLALQEEHGFLTDEQLTSVAREADVPLYKVQEVASFYPHFRREWDRPKRVEIQVCRDMTCHLRGSGRLLAKDGLQTLAGPDVGVQGVSCLGRCDRAPVCVVHRHGEGAFHDHVYAGRTIEEFHAIVSEIVAGEAPEPADADVVHLPHSNSDDWRIDPYASYPPPIISGEKGLLGSKADFSLAEAATGGSYLAVREYLKAHPAPIRGKDPKEHPWLCRLDPAGLLGMGGAGVPAYRKWLDVWQAAGDEKYIVCNGDESEPGTFKDREILLRMPHLVVEGVILAGLMTNATAGYIYIRHEYGEQIAAIRREIERAKELRACGPNIFGSGRAFSVEVFVSPGGYICGEQSALLEAMEDRRSQPRNRPPELSTNGLRDKPTVVNNVETLAWAPAILLRHNPDTKNSWYAGAGKPGFRGRRLLSISGDLERPGVYEIPIGTTLGELIELAGGVSDGRPLGAVAPSGPSGGLLPTLLPVAPGWEDRLAKKPEEASNEQWEIVTRTVREGITRGGGRFDIRSLPLDLHVFRLIGPALGLRVGLMLGAGLAVYAEGTNYLEQVVNFTEFFRNESCGKCVPCRLGSQKLVELGTAFRNGRIDLETVRADVFDLAYTLGLTSICGLGVVAPNPLATALDLFVDAR